MSKESVPAIHTPLPGPLAKALIERDEQFTSPSYTREYPLAVKSGRGAVIEDLDGNLFLDFTAGIAVCATGHCHPRVVSAIKDQADQLLHMSGTDFYYGPQANLAQRLAQVAPGDTPKKVFFTNSGAEAVEAAFKLARFHTQRKYVIAFFGAFHGRTLGALSLTASKTVQRRGFSPLVPMVAHAGFPNVYRSELSPEATTDNCIQQIENLLKRTLPPAEVAAVIVEPIQGEGGYIVPPDDFHRRLQALAHEHGALYVVDEVQSGMGRTGKMYASELFGVEPDILCTAKGIASGLPLGAIIAKEHVMNWPPGSHASTFGGNPLACVAALETIALLEEELIENAANVGQFLQDELRTLATRHPIIGDVRGAGLMIGAELVRDRATKEPAAQERNAVVQSCFHQGLLLLGCGESTLRFCPPLMITKEQASTAVRILDQVLAEM